MCASILSALLGALALPASPAALIVKEQDQRFTFFSGVACGSSDFADLRLPRRARAIAPVAPAIGTSFSDYFTGEPVARLVSRSVSTTAPRRVRFTVQGSDDVCANPSSYEDFGWETDDVRLRATYKIRERVYIKFSSLRQRKPRTFYFGASSRIINAHWRGWDRPRVRGRGVLPFNDCVPFCAAGNITNYAVKLKASRPRRCGGRYYYLKLTYRYKTRKPPGVQRKATMRARCRFVADRSAP